MQRNSICGKTVTASYGGKSVTVKIVDECMGCNTYDLDFSYDLQNSLLGKVLEG